MIVVVLAGAVGLAMGWWSEQGATPTQGRNTEVEETSTRTPEVMTMNNGVRVEVVRR